jgi:D-alanyl-D-alanine carboxypeptidase
VFRRLTSSGLVVVRMFTTLVAIIFTTHHVWAAPYAAMVMDARSGKVLHAENADTRLHPASLTKMMTLYVVFEAVENGEISLDTKVRISKKAAAEPPSKLGLRSGQRIKLRYLIRAAAVKSANDAATALGEAIEGSEAAFARRMNRTAKALGMERTTFKNAHGLTEKGHLSTARDMTILGRHLFYDYPDYYNLFSRIRTHAGLREVANTNRRFLGNYRGADGIKTGYTRAAGFNLVASAERGQERIITTVFGGRSTATRNKRVAQLMDKGFKLAPSRVAIQKPARPDYSITSTDTGYQLAGKTVRVRTNRPYSPRPKLRPAKIHLATTNLQSGIENALSEAQNVRIKVERSPAEQTMPISVNIATIDTTSAIEESLGPTVVSRLSTSNGGHWGINVGRFNTRYSAEKMLLKTALAEIDSLNGSLRKVHKSRQGFEATFLGLSEARALQACTRLSARNIKCSTISPG